MQWRILITATMVSVFMAGSASAQAFFSDGHFAVRKVSGICKMELTFAMENRKEQPGAEKEQPKAKKGDAKAASTESDKADKVNPKATAAILTLFNSEDYYSELITERKVVGIARGGVQIGFDNEKAKTVNFMPNSEGKDDHWRWQYLESADGLLANIGKRKTLQISFSNGKENYEFDLPLKGTSKAVTALKACDKVDEKTAEKAAVKTPEKAVVKTPEKAVVKTPEKAAEKPAVAKAQAKPAKAQAKPAKAQAKSEKTQKSPAKAQDKPTKTKPAATQKKPAKTQDKSDKSAEKSR